MLLIQVKSLTVVCLMVEEVVEEELVWVVLVNLLCSVVQETVVLVVHHAVQVLKEKEMQLLLQIPFLQPMTEAEEVVEDLLVSQALRVIVT